MTVSLNNAVEIQWLPGHASDLKGYDVRVNNAYEGPYEPIGTITLCCFPDQDAVNGRTYFYALSAFDINNNNSPWSADAIRDTPRPEGSNTLSDVLTGANSAGYSCAEYSVLPYTDRRTDFYNSTEVSGLCIIARQYRK
jgi:hypothetical protein